jgi:prepilin-type N-terminal cleavage/methylation domain-containing protein
MKRLLPKSYSDTSKGFTLIELMVVIAIIAILAVVSFAVYGNVQKNARDGRRKADITQIAHSIESSKVPGATTYTYNATLAANDFPQGIPADPTTAMNYCVATSATAGTAPANATTSNTSGCPTIAGTTYTAVTAANLAAPGTGATSALTGTVAAPTGTATSWVVCANLEGSTAPFCATSASK